MKRGLIAWDHTELAPKVFERRLATARARLLQLDLPALAVYSDLWRSNYGRFHSNFMPYFNRALLIIPREDKLVLLCGLSPRVYPWIKSVTILEEIVQSPDLAQKLIGICSQRGWKKIGFLDPEGLPFDLYAAIAGALELQEVTHEGDQWERAMYRRARELAWSGLNEEWDSAKDAADHEFAGRLELRYRRAGAEDLVILLTNGDTVPAPAKGQKLREGFSVSVALEYRGHWVKIAKHGEQGPGGQAAAAYLETLSGPLPFQMCEAPPVGSVVASLAEVRRESSRHECFRVFHGDTYWYGARGLEEL